MYEELMKTLRYESTWRDDYPSDVSLLLNAAVAIEDLNRCVDLLKNKLIDARSNVPEWKLAGKELPDKPGEYIVYIKDPWYRPDADDDNCILHYDTSDVTCAEFDKNGCLWLVGDTAYNANLACVDTAETYHVTHWMNRPEPPVKSIPDNT